MRICLVSRELYPYAGGGIAPIVAAAARQLSEVAEVVVVTSADHRDEWRRLRTAEDPRVLPDEITHLFVEEPSEGHGDFYHYMHAYSARVHDVLREHYGSNGPDVLEFCDYLAEGFVTIQAARTQAAWLRNTLVCVRTHTTSELCAVLDGHLGVDFEVDALLDAERYCLRHADRVLWSGGDVLETYRRYYGADQIAPDVEIPDAYLDESDGGAAVGGGVAPGQPVRFLYLGRMERRKGIHDLVRALLDTGRDDWRLTLLGGDTDTGPLSTSMRGQLELTAAGDERIAFAGVVPRAEVGQLIDSHDVVVVPSRWECWPNVGREALQRNRPLLATPVGGLTAMCVPGRSGWLADDTGRAALRRAVVRLLDDKQQVTDLVLASGPRERFAELCDADTLRANYTALAALARPRTGATRERTPLVSVVVPYFKLEKHIEETLDSVGAQTYGAIETIVVNDGSLREVDLEVLGRVAQRPGVRVVTQANAGLGAARNFGISQAVGEYVLPLDADDTIDTTFVARLVEVLECTPTLAYAGTWVQYMDEDGVWAEGDLIGYMPYGNWSTLLDRGNVSGVCTVLIRRSVFDAGARYDDELTSYEDWLFMRRLQAAGQTGDIVPEKLFHYRVRPRSMMRETGRPLLARLEGELRARYVEHGMAWTRQRKPAVAGEPPVPEVAVASGHEPSGDEALEVANAQLAAQGDAHRGAAAGNRLRAETAQIVALQQRVEDLESALNAARVAIPEARA